jgi:hypothetical protein
MDLYSAARALEPFQKDEDLVDYKAVMQALDQLCHQGSTGVSGQWMMRVENLPRILTFFRSCGCRNHMDNGGSPSIMAPLRD